MAGRRPKPTKLKELLGNPGHRTLNANEPQPSGEVRKPRGLKGRAAKLWNDYVPQLIATGVLRSTHADMFAVWCFLMAEFYEDPKRMNANRISQMRALGSSFGLDASSQSRLSVHEDSKTQKDPAEQYFSGVVTGPGNSLRQ